MKRAEEGDRRELKAPILAPVRPSQTIPREAPINAVSALSAFAIGVIHAGLAPVLAMTALRPSLMLVAVVTVTALFGLGAGATWAFVGGLTANLLTTDPLGILPLGLLLVAAIVVVLVRLAGRPSVVVAAAAGLLGSVVMDGVTILVMTLTGAEGFSPAFEIGALPALIVPAAFANGALAGAAWVVVRAVASRMGFEPTPV